jgi:hypothetical protein
LAETYSSSSAVARYAYGGDGEGVVKRFGSLSGSDLTPSKVKVYLPGGFEIAGSFSGGGLRVEWQSLALMDDRACVARFEVKTVDAGAATGEPAVLRHQVGNPLARLVVSAIEKPRRCRPSAEFLGCCLVVGARRLKPRGNTWKAPLGAPAAAIRDAVAARRAL